MALEFRCNFTICENAETLCDGYLRDYSDGEAASEAASAAYRALLNAGVDYRRIECSRRFSDWHGKHWSLPGKVAGEFWRRYLDLDADGDDEPGEWEWCDKSAVPADVLAEAERVQELAIDAMLAVLTAAGEEEDRRFAEEEELIRQEALAEEAELLSGDEINGRRLTKGMCPCGCGISGEQMLLPGETFRCQAMRDAESRARDGWTPANSCD